MGLAEAWLKHSRRGSRLEHRAIRFVCERPDLKESCNFEVCKWRTCGEFGNGSDHFNPSRAESWSPKGTLQLKLRRLPQRRDSKSFARVAEM